MSLINLLIAVCEMTLAVLLFQHSIVVRAVDGLTCGLRKWALGMSIGLFGLGRFTDFLDGNSSALVYTFGHFCLIGFTIAQYLQSRRSHGKVKDHYVRSKPKAAAPVRPFHTE